MAGSQILTSKYMVLIVVLGSWIGALGQGAFYSASAHQSLPSYEGSKTCMPCHEGKAEEVHASVHYQWQGATPQVPNLGGKTAGKWESINDFCTYPNINFLFQMTNLAGATVVTGCGTCHVGRGEPPSPTATQAQLENIDCLICHSDLYQRVGSVVNGTPGLVTAPTVDITTATAAIQSPPSQAACLARCHVNAGGGPGVKQGDIDPAQIDPPRSLDVHMSSQGAGLTCLDCHTAKNHRISGRGNDLRATDLSAKVDCLNCHSSTPHSKQDINKHTAKVHCAVCHIPTFARNAPTDILRDFTKTEVDAANRYEPVRTFATNLTPTYRWFNGLSYFYEFGKAILFQGDGTFLLSGPLGDIADSTAKIHAFKLHQAKLGYDLTGQRQIPVKSKILWETGDVDKALRQGAAEVGWSVDQIAFANSRRYFSLFHEVAPKENALSCTECHVSVGRMDFKGLGYQVRSTRNEKPLCTSCHSPEDADFYEIHHIHVDDKSFNCTTCHIFAAPPLNKRGKISSIIQLLLSDE